MATILLGEREVADLLDWDLCLAAADQAFALASAEPPTRRARGDLREEGRFGALLLASAAEGMGLVTKTNVHAFGEDAVRRTESVLILWDLASARPVAIVSARVFNDFRTAAGFAAAARRLVPHPPRTLLVVGTGKIARPSVHAMLHAFPNIDQVIVRGRDSSRSEAFADALRRETGVAVETARGPDRDGEADLVVTATTSREPVVFGERLRPGAVVVLGGANRPDAREADDALIARAGTIACDHVEGALEKAGDLVLARASGALPSVDRLVPLSSWRPDDGGDLRVFKSIGIGEQDLVLARALVARASAKGGGTRVDLEQGPAAAAPKELT